MVIRTAASCMAGTVSSWGRWAGRCTPISSSMGPVRPWGVAAGRVPADAAFHPGGGSALKIASAINERAAFSTQMKSTVRGPVRVGAVTSLPSEELRDDGSVGVPDRVGEAVGAYQRDATDLAPLPP